MVNLFLAGGRRKFLSENEYVKQKGAPRIPILEGEIFTAYIVWPLEPEWGSNGKLTIS